MLPGKLYSRTVIVGARRCRVRVCRVDSVQGVRYAFVFTWRKFFSIRYVQDHLAEIFIWHSCSLRYAALNPIRAGMS
jgi:hypothetical protein